MTQQLTLLGSTGSIGTQTLDVCRNLGMPVAALTAYSNSKLLEQQAREFHVPQVVIADETKYQDLKLALADTATKVLCGRQAIIETAATAGDIVLNSLVGAAGLRPTLAAIQTKKQLALANKETLVAAGALVTKAARENGVTILPVDSEHSAVLQCLQAGKREEMTGMILTASGGPFYGKKPEELADVTVEQALRHPNWSMGAKLTIDSATLMNKGLEFIEAMWLFDLQPSQIEVIIHRESVIHSAVTFADGSVIAQLGVPDMRIPIQYALTFPHHKPLPGERLSLTKYGTLSFAKPDYETFSCLSACITAMERGGLSPCIVNAANEAAVALFLQNKIKFLQIGQLVCGALDALEIKKQDYTLEDVEQADAMARQYVMERAGYTL